MREIEDVVAEVLPHAEVLVKTAEHVYDLRICPGSGQCICGADRNRAKMLLAVQRHVDRKTGGRVYLDRP